MRVGFSFSPGGLLLPYHLGVLDCLKHNKYLTEKTPIAGASAGAIAVAAHGLGIESETLLDDLVDIHHTCKGLGRARGNLLPLLRAKLETHVDEDRFQEREGETVVSYTELFPSFRPVHSHQAHFDSHEEMIDAVCHSSTFPFFSSNWPAALCWNKPAQKHTAKALGQSVSLTIPRVVVDGFFCIPGDRFGCPDFHLAGVEDVNRTVTITSFPRQVILLSGKIKEQDCICPELEGNGIRQCAELIRKATQPCSQKDVIGLYNDGVRDAERWCRNEENQAAFYDDHEEVYSNSDLLVHEAALN